MFVFIAGLLGLFAEGAHSSGSWAAFKHFYNDFFNYPGFEAWKFVNLAIFIAIMVRLVKTPLSETFKAKRESIRAVLIKAEKDRQEALSQLTSAEGKLAQLETDKATVLQKAKEEAEFEKNRLLEQTRMDIERLRHQSEAELTRLANQSRSNLRRFSAEESIRIAQEKLRTQIDLGTDARLVKANLSEIGGLN